MTPFWISQHTNYLRVKVSQFDKRWASFYFIIFHAHSGKHANIKPKLSTNWTYKFVVSDSPKAAPISLAERNVLGNKQNFCIK